MSALHNPTNLSRAPAHLRLGAEGATGDCPETRAASSLLHLTRCGEILLEGGEEPHAAPSSEQNPQTSPGRRIQTLRLFPVTGEPPCRPSPGNVGEAGDWGWGDALQTPAPGEQNQHARPQCWTGARWGPHHPSLLLPRDLVLAAPPSRGLKTPGVSSSSRQRCSSSRAGCPQRGCVPPSHHEQQTYRGWNQRGDCTDILAPSFHLGSPTWCLQSDVTSASRSLSHPSPLCLASEICACGGFFCWVFFSFKGLFFFFSPPAVASGLLPGDRRAIPV